MSDACVTAATGLQHGWYWLSITNTVESVLCRADWKTCQLEKPQEIARTQAFKAVFQPYDVVNS